VSDPRQEITALLQAWSHGDLDARNRLMPLVYRELRRCAAGQLRRERRGHTLQPTALVHESYLRLIDQRRVAWRSRAHFFAAAAEVMRRILVDRARAHKAAKRSGLRSRVALDPALAVTQPVDVDILDLNGALERLAAFDARKSRVAELRFFGGLSLEETGDVLGLSVATVERDWRVARAWLRRGHRQPQSPRALPARVRLLCTQGRDRVDACRASRGSPGGGHRRKQEPGRHDRKRPRLEGRHVHEEAGHHLADAEAEQPAQRNAGRRGRQRQRAQMGRLKDRHPS
jgi:RNA polymerase sigma factor (TIGR02999 family)